MSTKYVLVMDDEKEIRDLLKEVIATNFPLVKIIEAVDGMEALRKIANQKFNLIVCDLKMPKVDGMEVIKSLSTKYKDNKPDHIIVLSGNISQEQAAQLNKNSQFHFMAKPYDEDDFLAHLEKILTE